MKIQAKIVEMGKETGKELFEIEDIIDKDVTVSRGKSITKYRVRWKGYKAEEDSWLTYYPGDPDWIQDQKLVDNWERTRATDLDTENVQAKGKGRGTVNVQAKCKGWGTVSGVAVRTKDSLGIVAERGRGTKLVRARAAQGAQPGSLGTVPGKESSGGCRGLSSGLGPDATIRVLEPALEVIRVVELDLGIEVGREVRDSLRLKGEQLVVEDGLQASGGVKVVRLEVNSVGSEDSE
jgi:hypothetical protein